MKTSFASIFLAMVLIDSGLAQSFTIPLGKAIDDAGIGNFEMEPLFLGLDNINEQLNIGTIVGSANATIIPEVKDPVFGTTLIPRVTGDTRTGARVTGLVTGRAGLELHAHFDVGGIGPGADFEYTPTINPPTNFYAGERVQLNAQNGLNRSGAFDQSNIDLPSTGVHLDVIFDIHAAGKIDYGVAGLVDYNTEPFNFPIRQPKNDDGTNFTLIGAAIDLNDQDAFGVLTVLGAPVAIDPGENGTLFTYPIEMDPTPPPKDGEDPLFHRDIGEVALVKPELNNTLLVDTTLENEQISYAIDSKIVRLGADIDGIASALAAGNSYTRFSKTLGDPESDFNATIAGELVDLKYGPEIGYRYQSSVDTKLGVDVRFSRPVAVVDENGTRVTDQLSGTWNELPEIAVLGDESVAVDVTFTGAEFLLNEQGAITISDYLEFNALSLDANINVGPLPIPVLSLGPVLHERTSVLEHIDFPEIPEPPSGGPLAPTDPFATIRATKNVLDAIGEIKIFENLNKPLTSIAWEEGQQPTKQFVLAPAPSELVYFRDGAGFEKLGGEQVRPDSSSRLVFGAAPAGETIESEMDLIPLAYRGGSDGSGWTVQSATILEGSVVQVSGFNTWMTNRFENHGTYTGRHTSVFRDAGSGILTIGGTSHIDFLDHQARFETNVLIHEAGHTMRFLDSGHRFDVTQSFANHGTIEVLDEVTDLTLTDGFLNTGTFRVANSSFAIDAPVINNDGVIAAGADGSAGSIILSGASNTNLGGTGQYVVRDGGAMTFAGRGFIAENASPSFVVANGRMEFEDNLTVAGDANFIVEDTGILSLSGLLPLGKSLVALENRGTINVFDDVMIRDPDRQDAPRPGLVPINLDNTDGTIRIHPWGRLAFDAEITNYAEGGVTFDVGTWELIGAPVRWHSNDITSLPDNTPTAILAYRVVGVGDDSTLGDVTFDGDPDYSVDDFDTDLKINASDVTLSGAAFFPMFNTIEDNRGRIRVEKGFNLHTEGSFTNSGDIEVGANSGLIVRGDLLLHGGKLTVEPPEAGATGDLGEYGGWLFTDGRIEIVGAELDVHPGEITGVGDTGRNQRDNLLRADWLIQESSTTTCTVELTPGSSTPEQECTVEVTEAVVKGVAGTRGIEVLLGSVVLDGKEASFDALSSLRILEGDLTITGGNEFVSTAANTNFFGADEKMLDIRNNGRLSVEHSGSISAYGIDAGGDVEVGSNGSLSLEDVLSTSSRTTNHVSVEGVLHAEQVVIGEYIPGREYRTTLSGNGRIASDVDIQLGLLEPGDEEGLRILGDLQLAPESITRFVLDNGESQSRLLVDSATLSGSLEVLAAPTFDPVLNEPIELIGLNEGSADLEIIAGEFSAVSLAMTTSGKAFELSITPEGAFLNPYLLGDFNGDETRDATDIDLLSVATRLPYDERFDLNTDGQNNQADRVIWVEGYERTHFGDADLSGTVDFADFLLLSENIGSLGGWSSGDFDGDQRVDFPDFLLLSENFGEANAAVATVPEPSSLTVLLLPLFALSLLKRRLAS